MEDDLSRMLMAMSHVLGIWDGEMRVSKPSRDVLVESADEHWKLDERGYPVPSEALIREWEFLHDLEAARRQTVTVEQEGKYIERMHAEYECPVTGQRARTELVSSAVKIHVELYRPEIGWNRIKAQIKNCPSCGGKHDYSIA
jgi:hypothetical protein